MTPGKLRGEIIAERASWVREMLAGLRALPLDSIEDFESDARNLAAAESYLRRALEALLDLGRHVLAKGFGRATSEYEEIARVLGEVGVLDEAMSSTLGEMAGFRNRLVHSYDRVTQSELYDICRQDVGDVETVLHRILQWVESNPDFVAGGAKEDTDPRVPSSPE